MTFLEDTKIPSFTFCPYPPWSYLSIETFEDAMSEIDIEKKKYSSKMNWMKSYTKFRQGYVFLQGPLKEWTEH